MLAGHSMGVQVALEAHRRAPERVAGLVLVCGAPGQLLDTFHDSPRPPGTRSPARAARLRALPASSRAARFRALVHERGRDGVRARLRGEPRARAPRDDLQRYFDDLAPGGPGALRAAARVGGRRTTRRDHLPQVTVPTLVVAGERDAFTPLRLSGAHAPGHPRQRAARRAGRHARRPLEHPELVAERIARVPRRARARVAPRRAPRRRRGAPGRGTPPRAAPTRAGEAGEAAPRAGAAAARPRVRVPAVRRALAVALLGAPRRRPRAQPYDPGLPLAHARHAALPGPLPPGRGGARAGRRARRRSARTRCSRPCSAYAPRRTEIVLSDDQDDANGLATPLPYDTIRLFAVPPSSSSELHDYRDWLRQLVFHEYVHILHLDHVGGLPATRQRGLREAGSSERPRPGVDDRGARGVNESEATPRAGATRARSTTCRRARSRSTARSRALDEASNPLLALAARRRRRTCSAAGSWGSSRRATAPARSRASSASRARSSGRTRRRGSAAPLVRRQGLLRRSGPSTPTRSGALRRGEARAGPRRARSPSPRRLTRRGGQLRSTRASRPDGAFVACVERGLDERARAPPRRRGRARSRPRRDRGRERRVRARVARARRSSRSARSTASSASTTTSTGSISRPARRRAAHARRARDRSRRRAGRDARLRAAHRRRDVLALVRRRCPGPARPARGAVRAPRRRGLQAAHLAGRRASRSSCTRAGGATSRCGRTAASTRLTDDDALDTGPAWTPDGRFLLFASDRGGIFNLHAWEAATGAVRQVTNVETGALAAGRLAGRQDHRVPLYSRAGYDLATIPLDECDLARAVPAAAGAARSHATPTAAEAALPEPVPSRPYSAVAHGPADLLAAVRSPTAPGPCRRADGRRRRPVAPRVAAQGWWSVERRRARATPSRTRAAGRGRGSTSRRHALVDTSPGAADRLLAVWEYANVGRDVHVHAARARARAAGRLERHALRLAPRARAPPRTSSPSGSGTGFLSELSLQARYSDARRFVRSISPEEGRTRVAHAAARRARARERLRARARPRALVAQYAARPGHARTASRAPRLPAASRAGRIGGRAPFELGGSREPGPLSLLPGAAHRLRTSCAATRSARSRAPASSSGTCELRFPLGAPPLRPLHLAALPAPRARRRLRSTRATRSTGPASCPIAGHPLAADELRFGVGAELRLEVVLGYFLRTDVRLGVARPLGAAPRPGPRGRPGRGPRPRAEAAFYLTGAARASERRSGVARAEERERDPHGRGRDGPASRSAPTASSTPIAESARQVAPLLQPARLVLRLLAAAAELVRRRPGPARGGPRPPRRRGSLDLPRDPAARRAGSSASPRSARRGLPDSGGSATRSAGTSIGSPPRPARAACGARAPAGPWRSRPSAVGAGRDAALRPRASALGPRRRASCPPLPSPSAVSWPSTEAKALPRAAAPRTSPGRASPCDVPRAMLENRRFADIAQLVEQLIRNQ